MLLPVPRTCSGAGTADLRVMKISRPGKQPCRRCRCGRRQASRWVAGSRSSSAEAEGGPRCRSRAALPTRAKDDRNRQQSGASGWQEQA